MDAAPPADGAGALKRFGRDLREGAAYIAGEKGLLAITLYFMFSNFAGAGRGSCTCPSSAATPPCSPPGRWRR